MGALSRGGSSPLLRTIVMLRLSHMPWQKLLVSLVGLSLVAGLGLAWSAQGQNSQETDLRDQIEDTKRQIQSINIDLDGLELYSGSLEEAISQLDGQIADLEAERSDLQAEVDQLQTEIDQLQVKIDQQTEVLAKILANLYKQSGASTLELLFASDDFADFISVQEYLSQLKNSLNTSVLSLQNTEAKKLLTQTELQSSLDNLQVIRNLLAGQRQEKSNLLAETRNQERLFRDKVAELRARQAQQEADLQAYLASLIKTRTHLGTVAKGEVIGKLGNTGWSTGPHLHLAIYEADGDGNIINHFDPQVFLQRPGLAWPVGGNGGIISQGYHPGHRALDIAGSEGLPILAIESGVMIHRGCLWVEYGDSANFAVIIDHGGHYSLYVHLQAPNNPKYNDCNINRRTSYGTKSIDYYTTD